MSSESKSGLMILIGIGWLVGAAALAWFSSIESLRFTRGADGVTVTRESRMFGLILVSSAALEHVSAARTVTTPPATSRHRPFTQIYFDTPSGPKTFWSTQPTNFIPQSPEMEGFFADTTRPRATLTNLVNRRESMRFVFAQLAVVFIAVVGVGLLYAAYRSLF